MVSQCVMVELSYCTLYLLVVVVVGVVTSSRATDECRVASRTMYNYNNIANVLFFL